LVVVQVEQVVTQAAHLQIQAVQAVVEVLQLLHQVQVEQAQLVKVMLVVAQVS
jgi:hypothetical protein